MPHTPVPTFDTAPSAAQHILAELRQRSFSPGTVLNFHAQMSTSPALLAGYMGMRTTIEQFGTLDMKMRTAIMLSLSTTDGEPAERRDGVERRKRCQWRSRPRPRAPHGTPRVPPRGCAGDSYHFLVSVTRANGLRAPAASLSMCDSQASVER